MMRAVPDRAERADAWGGRSAGLWRDEANFSRFCNGSSALPTHSQRWQPSHPSARSPRLWQECHGQSGARAELGNAIDMGDSITKPSRARANQLRPSESTAERAELAAAPTLPEPRPQSRIPAQRDSPADVAASMHSSHSPALAYLQRPIARRVGRRCLFGLALGAVTFTFVIHALPSTARELELARRLVECSADHSDARRIGKRALDALEPAKTEALVDALALPARWRELTRDAVRGAFLGRVRREFAADRTVSVDGWVLSQSEARLYALAYRLRSSQRAEARPGRRRHSDNAHVRPTKQQGNARAASIEDGRAVYSSHCQGCHQSNGQGLGATLGADLNAPRAIRERSDAELITTIRDGIARTSSPMPAFDDVLDDRQTRDLVAYLRHAFSR